MTTMMIEIEDTEDIKKAAVADINIKEVEAEVETEIEERKVTGLIVQGKPIILLYFFV